MNVKDQETLQALLKKLSAVRVTLSDDEQAILDWLIQGTHAGFKADEVEAQRFTAPRPAPTPDPDEAMNAHFFKNQPQPAPTPGPDEAMNAHFFKNQPQPAPTPGPDEAMNAHRFTQPQVVKAESIILIYDPELEAYRYLS